MSKFRQVNEHLFVSPQLLVEDLAAAKDIGIKTILCNRPDYEHGPDQPTIETLGAETEALGMHFLALPFSPPPSPQTIAQQGALIDAAETPVLAYCRSGTRSITAWALSKAGKGQRDSILESAARAGYDLSGIAKYL